MSNHPDDATSVPLSSLRPGALFSTVTGWRGIKSTANEYGSAVAYSYDDGEPAWLDDDTPCWEIRIGGWKPANALPSKGLI